MTPDEYRKAMSEHRDRGTFGAASPCRRIDPATGEETEVISARRTAKPKPPTPAVIAPPKRKKSSATRYDRYLYREAIRRSMKGAGS